MRKTRLNQFGEQVPIFDLATGQARKNAEGATLTTTFIPHAIRKQRNPAAASAIIKEDLRVNGILEEAEAILNNYKALMSEKMKEIAGLEVTIRQEKLVTEFLEHSQFFSEALIIYHSLSYDEANDGPARQTDTLKHEVALNMIDRLTEEDIKALYLSNNDTAMKRYKTIFPTAKERGANWTADVGSLVETIGNDLHQLMAGMSTSLFRTTKKREQTRVNKSALLLFLEKEKATKATEDLSAALDQSLAIPERTMDDIIGKIARKNVRNEVQKQKEAQRKKSTGEAKSQALHSKPESIIGTSSRSNSRKQDGKPLLPPSVLRRQKTSEVRTTQASKHTDRDHPKSNAESQEGDRLEPKQKKKKKKKPDVSFQEDYSATPAASKTTPKKADRHIPSKGGRGSHGNRDDTQKSSGRGKGKRNLGPK